MVTVTKDPGPTKKCIKVVDFQGMDCDLVNVVFQIFETAWNLIYYPLPQNQVDPFEWCFNRKNSAYIQALTPLKLKL